MLDTNPLHHPKETVTGKTPPDPARDPLYTAAPRGLRLKVAFVWALTPSQKAEAPPTAAQVESKKATAQIPLKEETIAY
jgi:hypothetical protein